jgi:hypothetical protein
LTPLSKPTRCRLSIAYGRRLDVIERGYLILSLLSFLSSLVSLGPGGCCLAIAATTRKRLCTILPFLFYHLILSLTPPCIVVAYDHLSRLLPPRLSSVGHFRLFLFPLINLIPLSSRRPFIKTRSRCCMQNIRLHRLRRFFRSLCLPSLVIIFLPSSPFPVYSSLGPTTTVLSSQRRYLHHLLPAASEFLIEDCQDFQTLMSLLSPRPIVGEILVSQHFLTVLME